MIKLLRLTASLICSVFMVASCSSEKQGMPAELPATSTQAPDQTEVTTSTITSIAGSDQNTVSTTTVLSSASPLTTIEQVPPTAEEEVVATSTTILIMDSTTTIPLAQLPSFETVEPRDNFSMITVEPNA